MWEDGWGVMTLTKTWTRIGYRAGLLSRKSRARMRDLERATRPTDPVVVAALDRRWDGLPEHVKTPAQLVGRRGTGCEGTHGVFPQCDFTCKPCYHSKDANRVAIDGPHTLREVERQMAFLEAERGPSAFAQLIGGEVSLLDPDDHAATIETMRSHGRVPMSFTHGDIDAEYLEHLALRPDGSRRFDFLSFAGHFDMTMFGRRGVEKPTSERELNPARQRFAEMFDRLRRTHGVRSYLAHNMTVTPTNLDQVADVVRDCHTMGFRMFSFQPAAFVGNETRWTADYRAMTDDDVWTEIERGVGTRLPYKAIQFGDFRCNRVVWGVWVGERFVPILDDEDPADLRARDLFLHAFRGSFLFVRRPVMVARVLRTIARNPRVVPVGVAWLARFVRRAGGPLAFRKPLRPMTFVMHSFIDAADVAPAWEALQRGETLTDERLRATQERLAACVYSMAHPDTGLLVPACVQHSVLDPAENLQLVELLPRSPRSRGQLADAARR